MSEDNYGHESQVSLLQKDSNITSMNDFSSNYTQETNVEKGVHFENLEDKEKSEEKEKPQDSKNSEEEEKSEESKTADDTKNSGEEEKSEDEEKPEDAKKPEDTNKPGDEGKSEGDTEKPEKLQRQQSTKFALPQREIYLIFLGLMLSLFLAAVDMTVVSTALPTITRDLSATQDQYAWVQISYLLTFTALSPSYGRISDMIGRRNLYIICIVIFLIGSAICGASVDIVMLITARGFQGVGGGGLMSLAFVILGDIVSLRERGKYVGIMTGTFGISSVLGPFVGGVFTDHVGWRWIFYINLPIGIISLFVVWYGMRKLKSTIKFTWANLDILGTVIVVTAVVPLLLALTWGGNKYDWNSAIIISLLVVGTFLFIPFIIAEKYARYPIMPMRLFTIPNVILVNIIGFLVGVVMFSSMLYLPLWFQTVKGESAMISGIQMLPMLFGLIIASTVSGFLVAKFGHYKTYPIVGTILATAGTFLLYLFDENSGQQEFIPILFCIGFGLGLVVQLLIVVCQNAVEPKDIAVATSAVNFTRTLGGVFGQAVGSAILTQELSHYFQQAIDNQTIPNPTHIFVQSMAIMWLGLAPFCALAIPLTFFVKQVSLRKTIDLKDIKYNPKTDAKADAKTDDKVDDQPPPVAH